MLKCGLLGEKLGHSYSPQIHSELADYEYKLYEKTPEELPDFLKNGDFDGLNVTIPYKKTVIPYCAELSETAREIGAVNTLVRRADGSLYGDNTDAFGFQKLLEHEKINVSGKKCLVLGSGGASVMACWVLKKLGAREVVVISRSGENNYDNIEKHADAEIIVNTTPVGMYPKNGAAATDINKIPACEAVVDVVYNPAHTAIMLQAEKRGIKNACGLYMLVGQAKRSSEQFANISIPDSEIERIDALLSKQMQNIVLVGMPGSGKSSVAKLLGEKLGRKVIECDSLIVEKAGKSIPEIFAESGEEGFRKIETEINREIGKSMGCIISTGGGCVTREENYDLLHQNGTIIWIKRDIEKLPTDGRPLSQANPLSVLFEKRKGMYERFADAVIDNNGKLRETVENIMEVLG